jgi:hypothetical protein
MEHKPGKKYCTWISTSTPSLYFHGTVLGPRHNFTLNLTLKDICGVFIIAYNY